MPLTPIQHDMLRLLAPNRQPGSHLAGGTAINRSNDSVRFSVDVDLFHDDAASLIQVAENDAAVLLQNAFEVTWLERLPHMQRATIQRGGEGLKVEWCHDSTFRFFPIQADAEFGYCLHRADLATNKALALGGRVEIRDFIDIIYLHRTYLSLGAICWAACGKDLGFTPHSLLNFAKRHMKFREEELAREKLARPLSLQELKNAWLEAAEQAENLFSRLPLTEVGCLYLTPSFTPITPDPADPSFPTLIRHYGSIRGAWPVVV